MWNIKYNILLNLASFNYIWVMIIPLDKNWVKRPIIIKIIITTLKIIALLKKLIIIIKGPMGYPYLLIKNLIIPKVNH